MADHDRTLGAPFQLITAYCPDRSNYLTLPSPDIFNAAEAIELHPELKYFVFRLSWADNHNEHDSTEPVTRHVYISWRGKFTYADNKVVSIPSHVAESLDIPRSTLVTLQLVIPPAPTTFISLRPVTEQDYVIAESNDEYITSQLLTMVSLVNMHKPLRVWIRGSLVTFRPFLESANNKNAAIITEPSFVLLAPNTLVEISTVRETPIATEEAATDTVDKKTDHRMLTLQQPKFPNIQARVVPLPPLTAQLQQQELLTMKKAKKIVKEHEENTLSDKTKDDNVSTSSSFNNLVITQSYEEPTEAANIIYVSQDLYDMLGYNKAHGDIKDPAIMPIIVIRGDRFAKPPQNVMHKTVHEASILAPNISANDHVKQYRANYDPRQDYHMPFATPISQYFNSVLAIIKIKVHPHLKGLVIALHSVQRHTLLLPVHSQVYVSPYHPYLGEMVTNTSLLKYLQTNFQLPGLLGYQQHLMRHTTRKLDEAELNKEDQSVLRITYIPPSEGYRQFYKKQYQVKKGSTLPPPPPRTLISLEAQDATSMDFRTTARPSLRIRHIQFNLKDEIENLDPFQLPRSWVELSFYMYLSNLHKGLDTSKTPNGFIDNTLVFGPSTCVAIPLYVNTATVENEDNDVSDNRWMRGSSQLASKDSSLFTYQQLSPYCFRQIPTLKKTKPVGGYNGHYPHYYQSKNALLVEQQESDWEEITDDEEDNEDPMTTTESPQNNKQKNNLDKQRMPKTPYDPSDLFWLSGAYISLMVVPTLSDNNHPANFVTLQIQKIQHAPFIEDDDEQVIDTTIISTNVSSPADDSSNAVATTTKSDHQKQEKERKKVIYPLTSVFLTCTALDEEKTMSTQQTPLYTAREDRVTPLPSRFKYATRPQNKYKLQEDESDIDDVLFDAQFDTNSTSKTGEEDDVAKMKKLKNKIRHQSYGIYSDEDEDYEDEDDDDEEDDGLSPMDRLLNKKSGVEQKKIDQVESRKHNHKNITDDDNNWDDEDRKEEMAYFKSFQNQYREENQQAKEQESDFLEKTFVYTQRYRFNTPTNVSIFKPIIIPQLALDQWQTFCPPSPGDESNEKSKTVSAPAEKKGSGETAKVEVGGAPVQIGQTAAVKMMNGIQPPQSQQEEEEPEDPAIGEFVMAHIHLMQQRPYILPPQHIDLIYEHIAATIDHLDASLSLGFPINHSILYPTIQNPSVLHIPTSPLSGKAYIEKLPTTTLTNGDFTAPSPICISSPINTHMYRYLSTYPFSTNVIQWFDLMMTSLSILQPHFNHLSTLSPYTAKQVQAAYNRHSIDENANVYALSHTENELKIPTIIDVQKHTQQIAFKQFQKIVTTNNSKSIKPITTNNSSGQILSGMLTNVISHGILYGTNKSGKTTTACYLAHMLSQHPSINAHVIYVDCAPYEHASAQIVSIVFKHIFLSSRLKHRPCVIVLDNLDVLVHPHKEHEDNSLADTVIELLVQHHHQQLNERTLYPTILLATAKHSESLHPRIVSSLFSQYSCTLEQPTYIQRQFIINNQLNSFATAFSSRTTKQSKKDKELRQLDQEVLSTIINATEGYTFPDITLLVHKIVNHMTVQQQKKLQQRIVQLKAYYKEKLIKLKLKRNGQTDISPSASSPAIVEANAAADKQLEEDIKDKESSKEKELTKYKSRWGLPDISSELVTSLTSSYIPLPLRGIGLSKPTSAADQRKWWDCGALNNVIQTLRQTFEYPVLYPQLFNNSPLKLISGALLYGAPGSGKSALAAALQYSCPKLHFIRVKGPEVLDKYVGASEENVRKIFASARAAKPCVIFFDDFDSIALKRGSDSNGVTDRVVNQLLVEMDGVKGRSGVFVLAATTQPQLIDSALLRPGRLDLQLYCPLPETIQDREDILRAIVGCNLDYKPKPEEEVKNLSEPTVVEEKKNDEEAIIVAAAENKSETVPIDDEKSTKKVIAKKSAKTVAPPIQGASDYVFNTITFVRKQYELALANHNQGHGHQHSLDTPQGRTIATRKYKHKYPYVLADDVDFTKIAKLCKNFTGADMNALMINAMIVATQQDEDEGSEEEVSDTAEKKPLEPKKEKIPVEYLFNLPILTTEILVEAYDMTPLSLPPSDRSKFSEAFKKFIADKDQPEGMQKFDPKKGQRVAMAQ